MNVGLRGTCAGRGHDYKEKYVAMKPLSPSKDFKKEDIKEYKVSEPSTLHLARPSVVCCGSSAHAHNRANFDHEMVLMSAGLNQHEVSSQSRFGERTHRAAAAHKPVHYGNVWRQTRFFNKGTMDRAF